MSAACRSCNAPIVWTENIETGRRMPVDAEPDPEHGNVLLTSGNSAPFAEVLTNAQIAARPSRRGLHLSHFASCGPASSWRKGDRA